MWANTIIWHTRATYGCLPKSEHGLGLWPRLYAGSFRDVQAPLQLWCTTRGAVQVLSYLDGEDISERD